MNEFAKAIFWTRKILIGLIGLGLLSTFFININDVGTWRTILLIVFVIGILFDTLLSRVDVNVLEGETNE